MTDNNWLDRIVTPYNACSLETLPPLDDGSDALIPLVIGCYQLNESDDGCPDDEKKIATRSGELRLYSIRNDENLYFNDPQVVPMESGVLDGKWKQRSSKDSGLLFASACASGRIYLHSLSCDDNAIWRLDHVTCTYEGNESNALCLALAWDEYAGSSYASDRIVSSYSDGTIALHGVSYSDEQTGLQEMERWDAHSMFGCPSEVWTCSFLRGDENVVMSGADDVSYTSDLKQTLRNNLNPICLPYWQSVISRFGTFARQQSLYTG